MFAKPQTEHVWLDALIGNWSIETECQMGPDQPPQKSSGQATCRSLEGMWLLIESESESGDWSTLLTVGYDPAQSSYVGTFVGSMMTHLWIYQGSLDQTGKKLILNTEGPQLSGEGMARYQDSIELINQDHWILSSQMQTETGEWNQFMTSHHRRIT
ncbi:MAG: DUF1579 domain-containing protein [Planctomycetota bacterium]|jgi:hypothetical protein|uniref:DUF1579 domain-containing protein n=1 Tax=uncultured Gimesia sp. TaxID=1678688 RepID=UPI002635EF6B|nr:DUF1579 domain-containing protein [uncultured Gimesia sp.]